MNQEMLDYMIKNIEIAVRRMARDRSPLHIFDVGKGTDGVEYSCVILVAPKDAIEKFGAKFGGLKGVETASIEKDLNS